MSLQIYTLASPVFRPAESSNAKIRVKVIESLRYFIHRLCACWHLQMGLPFTRRGHTYRACAKCGMRRDFDLNTWKMKGRYYSHPVAQGGLTLLATDGRNRQEQSIGNREPRLIKRVRHESRNLLRTDPRELMIKAIRLTLSIFLLSGYAAAQGTYEAIDTKDFVTHPEIYEGRMVAVRADVIAIGADSKSLQLFDEGSLLMIGVKLTKLTKAQRIALMRNPVRHLLVYGQATVNEGRLVIDAHEVEDLQLERNIAGVSTGDVGAGGS